MKCDLVNRGVVELLGRVSTHETVGGDDVDLVGPSLLQHLRGRHEPRRFVNQVVLKPAGLQDTGTDKEAFNLMPTSTKNRYALSMESHPPMPVG